MKTKTEKAKEIMVVFLGIIIALCVSAIIVVPIILKLELARATIQYLDRH